MVCMEGRDKGQGTGTGLSCGFWRCLFPGRVREELQKLGLAEAYKQGRSWEGIQFPTNKGFMGEKHKVRNTLHRPMKEHRERKQLKRANRVSRNIEISRTGDRDWG